MILTGGVFTWIAGSAVSGNGLTEQASAGAVAFVGAGAMFLIGQGRMSFSACQYVAGVGNYFVGTLIFLVSSHPPPPTCPMSTLT